MVYKKKCSWSLCDSNSEEGQVSIFSIPREQNLKSVWVRNIINSYPNGPPPKLTQERMFVCEKHFHKSDLIGKSQKKGVTPKAIPYGKYYYML